MPNISIKQTGDIYSVVVDGVEMTNGLRGLDVTIEAGRFTRCHPRTRVTLDVLIAESFQLDSEDAIVIIPEATADTLKALGWTPPLATS